jgi:acyl carrier protein
MPQDWEVEMASVDDRVKNIVVELLGVDADRVVPVARFREDLEADSLDLVELIMAFEEEFGGEITDEDAQKITTVGEAIEYINHNMAQG